jgi:hypothetical protein
MLVLVLLAALVAIGAGAFAARCSRSIAFGIAIGASAGLTALQAGMLVDDHPAFYTATSQWLLPIAIAAAVAAVGAVPAARSARRLDALATDAAGKPAPSADRRGAPARRKRAAAPPWAGAQWIAAAVVALSATLPTSITERYGGAPLITVGTADAAMLLVSLALLLASRRRGWIAVAFAAWWMIAVIVAGGALVEPIRGATGGGYLFGRIPLALSALVGSAAAAGELLTASTRTPLARVLQGVAALAFPFLVAIGIACSLPMLSTRATVSSSPFLGDALAAAGRLQATAMPLLLDQTLRQRVESQPERWSRFLADHLGEGAPMTTRQGLLIVADYPKVAAPTERVARCLDDRDPWVRALAVRAACKRALPLDDAIAKTVSALPPEPSDEAFRSLGEDPPHVAMLLGMALDGVDPTRWRARNELAALARDHADALDKAVEARVSDDPQRAVDVAVGLAALDAPLPLDVMQMAEAHADPEQSAKIHDLYMRSMHGHGAFTVLDALVASLKRNEQGDSGLWNELEMTSSADLVAPLGFYPNAGTSSRICVVLADHLLERSDEVRVAALRMLERVIDGKDPADRPDRMTAACLPRLSQIELRASPTLKPAVAHFVDAVHARRDATLTALVDWKPTKGPGRSVQQIVVGNFSRLLVFDAPTRAAAVRAIDAGMSGGGIDGVLSGLRQHEIQDVRDAAEVAQDELDEERKRQRP